MARLTQLFTCAAALLLAVVVVPIGASSVQVAAYGYDGVRAATAFDLGEGTHDNLDQRTRAASFSRDQAKQRYDDRSNLARASARLDDGLLAPQTAGMSLPVHQPGSLTNAQARAFCLEGERGIAALNESMIAQGVPARARALELIQTRNALRTQARSLMADRQAAELLNLTDPNRTLAQLVGNAYQNKGLVGDLWEYLAGSASRSRTSVNEAFGL